MVKQPAASQFLKSVVVYDIPHEHSEAMKIPSNEVRLQLYICCYRAAIMFASRNNTKYCRWLEMRQLGAIAGSLLEETSFPFSKIDTTKKGSQLAGNVFIFSFLFPMHEECMIPKICFSVWMRI